MEPISNLKIRKMELSDRNGLRDILKSDDTFRADELSVALELIDDSMSHGDKDYWVHVAQSNENLVGYICFGPTPMTDQTFDLYWIVTHARNRGRGVAAALVRSMEKELRANGGRAVRVETSQSEGYQAAREFYRKLGYPMKARFENFYRVGDDLLVYYKQL